MRCHRDRERDLCGSRRIGFFGDCGEWPARSIVNQSERNGVPWEVSTRRGCCCLCDTDSELSERIENRILDASRTFALNDSRPSVLTTRMASVILLNEGRPCEQITFSVSGAPPSLNFRHFIHNRVRSMRLLYGGRAWSCRAISTTRPLCSIEDSLRSR